MGVWVMESRERDERGTQSLIHSALEEENTDNAIQQNRRGDQLWREIGKTKPNQLKD